MASSGRPAGGSSGGDRGHPRYRSHLLPRTRSGKLLAAIFLALFAFTEPPAVFALANRIQPWLLGMPFLYAYLLFLYVALIAVLVAALRRGV